MKYYYLSKDGSQDIKISGNDIADAFKQITNMDVDGYNVYEWDGKNLNSIVRIGRCRKYVGKEMTIDCFREIVSDAYHRYVQKVLSFKPEEIFDNAYDIAKVNALFEYLTNETGNNIEKLFPYAYDILEMLYEYEAAHYDEPYWTTTELINILVNDLLEDINENDPTHELHGIYRPTCYYKDW